MLTEKYDLKDVYDFLGGNGRDPKLEVYCHDAEEVIGGPGKYYDPRPAIVLCPGGGYEYCSPREAHPIASKFFAEGFNVFILYYSVKPHTHPWPLIECAAVFDMIKKNAVKWYTDLDKIAIMGFSAGGHAAAHYSVKYDFDEVKEYFPDSPAPAATVLGYPVITGNTHAGSIKALSGMPELNEETDKKFSVHRYVRPDTPPAFIWHTITDKCVPWRSSLLYAEELIKNNINCELLLFPTGVHGLATGDRNSNKPLDTGSALTADWIPMCIKFLNFVFEGKQK